MYKEKIKEEIRLKIMDLLCKQKDNENIKNRAVEVLFNTEEMKNRDFYEGIVNLKDWRVQWVLMRFWFIIHKGK